MTGALKSLKALTQLTLDAELARLKALSDELGARHAEVETLMAYGRDRAAALAQGAAENDLAFALGRDEAWLAWSARQRSRLSLEIAQVKARREAQRVVASRAFGRVEAIAELDRREAEQRRLTAARRGGSGD